MKKLLFAILLCNVVVYAWFQLRGGEQVQQEQPSLLEDKIRMQGPLKGEPINETHLLMPTPAVVLPHTSSELKLSMNISPQPVSKDVVQSCMEWGDFSGPDLDRATIFLSGLQLGDKITKRLVEHDTGYWVFIPPLKNKNAVNRKIGELRNLGVKDYFAVTSEGRWRNAISLGVFKTRDSAQNLYSQLRAKGVRSAQIGERASKIKTTRFILSGLSPETKAKLVEIQKDFSGSDLQNTSCALTR